VKSAGLALSGTLNVFHAMIAFCLIMTIIIMMASSAKKDYYCST